MGTRERKLLIYTNLLIIFHFPLLSTHSFSDIHKRFSFLIFLLPHSLSFSYGAMKNFYFHANIDLRNIAHEMLQLLKRVYDFKDDEFVFLFIQQSYFYTPAMSEKNLTGKDLSWSYCIVLHHTNIFHFHLNLLKHFVWLFSLKCGAWWVS